MSITAIVHFILHGAAEKWKENNQTEYVPLYPISEKSSYIFFRKTIISFILI